MNVSGWWGVYVLKRVSWLELVCWRLWSVHLPWPPPTTLASAASDSCVKGGKCYKAGCRKPGHKFWLWARVKKKLAWACSPVYRRGVAVESDLRGRRRTGCVQEVEKEHFKGTFQKQIKWAWFTLDLSYLNFRHLNSCTCQPSYQREKITCLSLMKDTLEVFVFLYLPLELKVVAGSSHFFRNRSPGFWKSLVLELKTQVSADLL